MGVARALGDFGVRGWWLVAFASLLLGFAGCSASLPGKGVPRELAPPRSPLARGASAAASLSPLPTAAPKAAPLLGFNPFAGPGFREQPADPANLCEPARANLTRAAHAILNQAPSPRSPRGRAWDRSSQPRFLERVSDRVALTQKERALLSKNAFVVLSRVTYPSYTDAYHDIYQSQLPLFVSVDSVLHAVWRGYTHVLIQLEQAELSQKLEVVVRSARAKLKASVSAYPAAVAQDVDTYLAVGEQLLTGSAAAGAADQTSVSRVVKLAEDATHFGPIDIFGRTRMVDFTQYRPRGHYAKPEYGLEQYFRAAMWFSRLELNLVSRSSRSSAPGVVPDPRETPHEAEMALVLADVIEQAGVGGALRELDDTWLELAGPREDVSQTDIRRLRQSAGITSLSAAGNADKLRAAIGSGFKRKVRMHYMPQGSVELPVITTLLGARPVVDAEAMTGLVHGSVSGRYHVGAGDLGFMLGHDAARKLLSPELRSFPQLEPALKTARGLVQAPGAGMYGSWLHAVSRLSEPLTAPEAGVQPSFVSGPAFKDFRMASALAGYAQLRHGNLLLAGQAYDEGGCEVPDGFVEPAPGTYAGLIEFAKRGQRMTERLGAKPQAEYFERLAGRLAVLARLGEEQSRGARLSEAGKRWLSMVVEIKPPSSDGPGSYDGWYFDLFPRTSDAFDEASLVVDYYTSVNTGQVSYVGALAPRLGLFVVDTGGEPRVMVGPVAHSFEYVARGGRRLRDSDVSRLKGLKAPWQAAYAAPNPPEPALALADLSELEVAVKARRATKVIVELLNHHREVIARGNGTAGPRVSRLRLKPLVAVPDGESPQAAEVVRVRVGDYSKEWRRYLDGEMTTGRQPAIDYAETEKLNDRAGEEGGRLQSTFAPGGSM